MKLFLALFVLSLVACGDDLPADENIDAGAFGADARPDGSLGDAGRDAAGPTDDADATEPDATEPDATEPDATEPDATEPDATEPDAIEPEQLIDIDGNVYATVQIGDQVWMAENLRVRTLRDGTSLVRSGDAEDWHYLPDEERAPAQYNEPGWVEGTLEGFLAGEVPEGYYGLLYNERALRSGQLAPEGWRLPTPADFEELIAFAGANGGGEAPLNALLATESWGAAGSERNGSDLFGFRLLSAGYVSAVGEATGAPYVTALATDEVDEEQMRRISLVVDPTALDESGLIDQSSAIGPAVRLIRED